MILIFVAIMFFIDVSRYNLRAEDIYTMMQTSKITASLLRDDIKIYAIQIDPLPWFGRSRYEVFVFCRQAIFPRYRLSMHNYMHYKDMISYHQSFAAGWHTYRFLLEEGPQINITESRFRGYRVMALCGMVACYAFIIKNYFNEKQKTTPPAA